MPSGKDETLERSVNCICNTCGLSDPMRSSHDCALVLLGRARWLILHYAHNFNGSDKKEALPLVGQIAGLLTRKARN